MREGNDEMELREFECIDRELGELLPLLEDQLLDEESERLLESHVQACQRCEEDRRHLRRLIHVMRGLPADATVPAGRRRPLAAMVLRRGPLGVGLGIGIGFAALALVCVLAGWWSVARYGNIVAQQVTSLEGRVTRIEGENRTIAQTLARRGAERRSIYPVGGLNFATPPNF